MASIQYTGGMPSTRYICHDLGGILYQFMYNWTGRETLSDGSIRLLVQLLWIFAGK